MKEESFKIIELTAEEKKYYPSYMEKEDWMGDNCVSYSEIEIPLGHSRYGGCVVDLPKDMEHPEEMRFAGQLDLKEISKYDQTGLLPKTGQLIFFADLLKDKGKVIYVDVENENLRRLIIEHEDNFFLGVLIKKIRSTEESFSDYYEEPYEDDLECWECEDNILTCACDEDIKKNQMNALNLNKEGKIWGDFNGCEKSKIFGVYANCQLSSEEKLEVMKSKIVLLQIGENGFNDEGVFNILIEENDLRNNNFENCILEWSQT